MNRSATSIPELVQCVRGGAQGRCGPMQSSGLATKIQVPLKTHQTLHRAQLVETLERGIPAHKLTLILAPAGYGKTTLLSQWAHTTRHRVAWLSLGEEDNDPNDFFR